MGTSFVFRYLRRRPFQSALSLAGIVLGVSVLLFCAALGEGVNQRVLVHVLPDRHLEVVPRTVQLGGIQRRGGLFGGSGSGLEDFTVDDLRALPGVVGVYPKQQLSFPATVYGGGAIIGDDMYAEFVGEGLEPSLVSGATIASTGPYAFADWVAAESCEAAEACGAGAACVDGRCERPACVPDDELWWAPSQAAARRALHQAQLGFGARARVHVREVEGPEAPVWALVRGHGQSEGDRARVAGWGFEGTAPATLPACEDESYCDSRSRRCEAPVPVLVSPSLLELYNGSVQSVFRGTRGAQAPPRLSEEALIGMTVNLRLGEGMLGEAVGLRDGGAVQRTVPLRLVGFSSLAVPIGATVPRGYVTRWNAEFGVPASAHDFSSILVEVSAPKDLNRVVVAVRESLNLDIHPRDEAARRAAGLVAVVMGLFGLLALVILCVGALQIAQTFALRTMERRREYGTLRSIGARAVDIFRLVVTEAAVLGVAAGLVALPLTWALATGVDAAFGALTPDFPFKPEGLFVFTWAWSSIAFGLGVLASVAGAVLPAWKVARMSPVDAMRERR